MGVRTHSAGGSALIAHSPIRSLPLADAEEVGRGDARGHRDADGAVDDPRIVERELQPGRHDAPTGEVEVVEAARKRGSARPSAIRFIQTRVATYAASSEIRMIWPNGLR